ncbi:MAG TPA: hypothetical protein VK997_13005 [Deferrisomatales bacterium]|nr:hypothetical protein [Deferrisomatales bacterium]
MSNELQKLIRLFQEYVSRAENRMREHFGLEEPRNWNRAGFPRNGEFGSCSYSFHGAGCRFDFGEREVDYDYGDQWRTDGFDLWRLSIFGEQFEEFSSYVSSGALKADFKTAVAAGEIRPSGGKYDNLYYLAGGL